MVESRMRPWCCNYMHVRFSTTVNDCSIVKTSNAVTHELGPPHVQRSLTPAEHLEQTGDWDSFRVLPRMEVSLQCPYYKLCDIKG